MTGSSCACDLDRDLDLLWDEVPVDFRLRAGPGAGGNGGMALGVF